MENECEALPGVAYPGVRDNRSTLNTKTGYDDDDKLKYGSFSRVISCHDRSAQNCQNFCSKCALHTRTQALRR